MNLAGEEILQLIDENQQDIRFTIIKFCEGNLFRLVNNNILFIYKYPV